MLVYQRVPSGNFHIENMLQSYYDFPIQASIYSGFPMSFHIFR